MIFTDRPTDNSLAYARPLRPYPGQPSNIDTVKTPGRTEQDTLRTGRFDPERYGR